MERRQVRTWEAGAQQVHVWVSGVDSMQIEHDSVTAAEAGQDIGIKVPDHVRPHDRVFRLDS